LNSNPLTALQKQQNTNSESYEAMRVIHNAIIVKKFNKNQGTAINKILCKGGGCRNN
jgi:hypothetical protein